MKKKKLKKIAKFILEESKNQKSKNQKVEYTEDCVKAELEKIHQCECDREVTEKLFTLITGLVKFKNKINFNITNDYISIHGNLDNFKKTRTNMEDYIEIHINKDGFRVSRGYTNLNFKDSDIFNRILPIVIEANQEVSSHLLEEVVDDIMVITKLSRDNNLEELLK